MIMAHNIKIRPAIRKRVNCSSRNITPNKYGKTMPPLIKNKEYRAILPDLSTLKPKTVYATAHDVMAMR